MGSTKHRFGMSCSIFILTSFSTFFAFIFIIIILVTGIDIFRIIFTAICGDFLAISCLIIVIAG